MTDLIGNSFIFRASWSPNACEDMFIEELVDVFGTPGVLDFIHLPWDTDNNTNIGYGFVNFVTPELAQAMRLFK
eukprot:6103383-Amphidinium_carterae.1